MPPRNKHQPRADLVPKGTPVRAQFDHSAAGVLGSAVEAAFDAIETVHGDGTYPPIPIHPASIFDRGIYTPQALKTVPHGIRLRTENPTAALDLVHEVFHALDHRVFGRGRDYATAFNASSFHAVQEALVASDAHHALVATGGKQRVKLGAHLVPTDRRMLKYLMNPGERIARAYAQFIAIRSGSERLLSELAMIRSTELAKHYPEQWSDEDFEPIAAAFDELLEEKGWLARKQ